MKISGVNRLILIFKPLNDYDMNTQNTLDQLHQLKLKGMAQAYEALLAMPVHEQLTIDQAVARLTEAELQSKAQQKTQMFLRLSKLRYNALIEQVHCSATRNITREQLASLADCSFIIRAENILITGPTGSGKSYLACALGRQACTFGYRVLYMGMTRLLEKIGQARLDGTYVKMLNQIEKVQLIILDDFGLQPMDNNVKLSLLQMLEDRYGKKATIITSQLPVKNWYEYLSEPTLADAIMDRLSAKAHRLELKGESLRKMKSDKIN
jgi:DNA replication protein DnaC